MRKRARHSLDRKPEIISDILTRHSKLDFVAGRNAVGHFEQKARHAFLRALDQQQDMISHMLELAARKFPKLTCDVMVPRSERNDGASLDQQKFGIGDRLGGESVHLAGL